MAIYGISPEALFGEVPGETKPFGDRGTGEDEGAPRNEAMDQSTRVHGPTRVGADFLASWLHVAAGHSMLPDGVSAEDHSGGSAVESKEDGGTGRMAGATSGPADAMPARDRFDSYLTRALDGAKLTLRALCSGGKEALAVWPVNPAEELADLDQVRALVKSRADGSAKDVAPMPLDMYETWAGEELKQATVMHQFDRAVGAAQEVIASLERCAEDDDADSVAKVLPNLAAAVREVRKACTLDWPLALLSREDRLGRAVNPPAFARRLSAIRHELRESGSTAEATVALRPSVASLQDLCDAAFIAAERACWCVGLSSFSRSLARGAASQQVAMEDRVDQVGDALQRSNAAIAEDMDRLRHSGQKTHDRLVGVESVCTSLQSAFTSSSARKNELPDQLGARVAMALERAEVAEKGIKALE